MLLEPTDTEGTYLVKSKELQSGIIKKENKLVKASIQKSNTINVDDQYVNFLNMFKVPRESRAKRMSKRILSFYIDALIVLIEEIYSEKFDIDTGYLKNVLKDGKNNEIIRPSFAKSIYDFLARRVKSDKQLSQVLS